MIRLFLIRHGRSTWNATGRIQGQADPPLDDVGREQARRLAERLRDDPPVALYTSPLQRAQETAEIIGETLGLLVVPDERLQEYDVGDIAGLTWEQVVERYPDIAQRWAKAPEDIVFPGAEQGNSFQARVAAAFDELFARHTEGPIGVVSHGGTIGRVPQPPDRLAHLALTFPLWQWVVEHRRGEPDTTTHRAFERHLSPGGRNMIVGNKVRLRPIERADLPRFVEWFADPEVRRYLLLYLPFSLAQEERWFESMLGRVERQESVLLAIETSDGVHIGNIGLHSINWKDRNAELGITIGEKAYWNQGYGTDAIRTMLGLAFREMNLRRATGGRRQRARNPLLRESGIPQGRDLTRCSVQRGSVPRSVRDEHPTDGV